MNIDWHTVVAALSVIILLGSVVPYLWSIAKGSTRPHILSQVGWGLLAGIAAAGQFAEGAGWSVVVPVVSSFNTALIIVVALVFKKIYALHAYDLYTFLGGIVALGGWALTHNPIVAIYIAVFADFCFTVPTYIKTHKDPSSEALLPWTLYASGSFLGLVTLSSFDIHNVAYPLWGFVAGSTIALLSARQHIKIS